MQPLVFSLLLGAATGSGAADGPAGKITLVVKTQVAQSARRCFEEQLKRDKNLEGRIVIAAKVKKGQLAEASLKEDHLGNAAVTACVLTALKSANWQSVPDVEFVYPFGFVGRTRTLAVLPFENLGNDQKLDWLRGGIAETLMSKLGRVKTLVLVERARLKDVLQEEVLLQRGVTQSSHKKMGELLDVDLLVLGSFQGAGERVRMTARVVDVGSGEVREAAEITGALSDIFDLQDQLSQRLADAMDIGTDPEVQKAVTARVAGTRATLELLGNASNAYHGVGEKPDNVKAATLYQQVITLLATTTSSTSPAVSLKTNNSPAITASSSL